MKLALSLDHVGFMQQAGGGPDGEPGFALEESLKLAPAPAGVRKEVTPQALRDLSSSLNSVGRLRQETGDLAGSVDAYDESTALARRLLKELGPLPETLRDLSVSLANVGMGQREAGDLSASVAAYEEAVAPSPPPACGLRGDARGVGRPCDESCGPRRRDAGTPVASRLRRRWKSLSRCSGAGWRCWARRTRRWLSSLPGSAALPRCEGRRTTPREPPLPPMKPRLSASG